MEKKRKNRHDENFKHNFTSKNVAHDFLKHNLPKEALKKIDLSTVRVESNDLLPSRYRSKRRADIIYSVEDIHGEKMYSIIHLEAQSKHDRNMAIRVWEYHVAIGRVHLKRGYTKIPLILTFVLYHGEEEWTTAKSIAELFADFSFYSSVSLRSPFLINLTKEEIEKLKRQEAAAAPQILMKQQATGQYCEVLPDLWELMKEHGQADEENIDYMATYDMHGESGFLEKFCKLDPTTANDYKIMFEQAIQREVKKEVKKATRKVKVEALKEGIQQGKELGIQQGIQQGKEQGIQQGKEEGIQQGIEKGIQAIKDLLAKGIMDEAHAKKAINAMQQELKK